MVKKYTTVSVETEIIEQIRKKFTGESLNKALKIMLIESGDYEPTEDDGDNYKVIYDNLQYYVNSRLKNMTDQLEDRFARIESEFQR